jgi:hypothetical protein
MLVVDAIARIRFLIGGGALITPGALKSLKTKYFSLCFITRIEAWPVIHSTPDRLPCWSNYIHHCFCDPR